MTHGKQVTGLEPAYSCLEGRGTTFIPRLHWGPGATLVHKSPRDIAKSVLGAKYPSRVPTPLLEVESLMS